MFDSEFHWATADVVSSIGIETDRSNGPISSDTV